MTDDGDRLLFEHLRQFESELGLPSGWYFRLSEEPDWPFVIKLHALLEAALVHVIDAALNRPELRNYVERLNVGGYLGKLGFAEALNAIEPKHARFIRALSDIRNQCVHDVRNVEFSLKGSKFVDKKEEAGQKFFAAFQDLLNADLPLVDGKRIPRDEFVRTNTRLALWLAALVILAEFYTKKELAQLFRRGMFGAAAHDLLAGQ
jgi:hypothetical protein